MDIDDSWATYIKLLPYVNNYLPKNLYDIKDGSYDICFCSHTIEHLEDPITFVRKLTDIASEFAVCYCPFDEKNISPRSGHRVIDDKIIAQINPIYTKLIKSINRKSEDLYYIFFHYKQQIWSIRLKRPSTSAGRQVCIPQRIRDGAMQHAWQPKQTDQLLRITSRHFKEESLLVPAKDEKGAKAKSLRPPFAFLFKRSGTA